MQKWFFVFALVALFHSNSEGRLDPSALSDAKGWAASKAKYHHNAVGYNTARKDLLGGIALEQGGSGYYIVDVYCEHEYMAPGPGKIPNNNVLNVEHTWPQSKFGGGSKGLQKSDLHHLYPSDSEMNSTRGNLPFGDVVTPKQNLKCQESKLGNDQKGQRVFEPPTSHKGNVARAMFYFSVRYGLRIDPAQEETFKRWHKLDPVDAHELERNDEIEEIQGNRNPFIDEPELVDLISDF